MASFEEAKLVKRRHSSALLQKPGVCGVDIQTNSAGEATIHVHLDPQVADSKEIPDDLDGIPVKCEFTGPFKKQ